MKFRWHKTGLTYTLRGFIGATILCGEAGFTASIDGRTKIFGDIDEAFSWVESLV